MNNQDEDLIQLIEAVVEGKAQKKELCNKIYKEVYALSYPVFRDEEKSMTEAKKALIEVCNRVENINLSKNVHKQIAVIVSSYFMGSAVKEHENELRAATQMNEYEYSRIREDEDLLDYMKKKASVFRSPKAYDEHKGELDSLNSVYMALLELYAYEMQSVDDIEQLTDIDSSYISGWIADIRAAVLGYDIHADAVAVDDDSADSVDSSDEMDSDEDTANGVYESDDEPEDDEEAENDEYNDEYEEKRAVSSVYNSRKSGKENSVTLFIKKLFPDLSLSARKTVSWISGCVVVIVLVSALLVSVVSAKNRKKVNSSYDYKNMQQYTSGQAPTRQSATKKQRTEEDKNTEATTVTEAAKEVVTEATTEAKAAKQQNDNNSDDSEQRRPADNSDDVDDNKQTPSNDDDNNKQTSSDDDDKKNDDNKQTPSDDDDKKDDDNKQTSSDDDNKKDDKGNSGNNENPTSSSTDDKGNSDNGNNEKTTSSSDDDKNMGGGIIIR